jgi:hypothetical protein
MTATAANIHGLAREGTIEALRGWQEIATRSQSRHGSTQPVAATVYGIADNPVKGVREVEDSRATQLYRFLARKNPLQEKAD